VLVFVSVFVLVLVSVLVFVSVLVSVLVSVFVQCLCSENARLRSKPGLLQTAGWGSNLGNFGRELVLCDYAPAALRL
jgi:hypothetical protein